jgi:hypothetical protein
MLGMLYFHRHPGNLFVRSKLNHDDLELTIYDNRPEHLNHQVYSDRPHLKSRDFVSCLFVTIRIVETHRPIGDAINLVSGKGIAEKSLLISESIQKW